MSIPNFSGLTLVVPPSALPLSVADVRAHSRILQTAEDGLIAGYLASAVNSCEDKCRRAFMPQTWRLTLNMWPGRKPGVGYYEPSNIAEYWKYNRIEIPKPPLVSIVSFTYMDTSGVSYDMVQSYLPAQGGYQPDFESEPGAVGLPFSGIWPTTILFPHSAIRITYECGYPAYSGFVNIDATGAVTWVSGDKFDSSLCGTWISVSSLVGGSPPKFLQSGSFNVLSVTDEETMQVVMPYPVAQTAPPIAFPLTDASWSGNAVPMPIRNAILYLTAHRYENREPVSVGRAITAIEIPETADALLAPYKIAIS